MYVCMYVLYLRASWNSSSIPLLQLLHGDLSPIDSTTTWDGVWGIYEEHHNYIHQVTVDTCV